MNILITMMHLDENITTPAPSSYLKNVEDAQLFRTTMEETARSKLCAICSCFGTAVTVIKAIDLENLDLLLASAEKDRANGLPRAALTRAKVIGNVYCLQQIAFTNDMLSCCADCMKALSIGNIPQASLVGCDSGPTPDWLYDLTWLEQQLVKLRTHQHVVNCIGKGSNFGPKHKAIIGHSHCKRNPALEDFT
jgi:hypothetical protein